MTFPCHRRRCTPNSPRPTRHPAWDRPGRRGRRHRHPPPGPPVAARRRTPQAGADPALGLVIAALAIIFNEVTGKGADQVLFSGENALAPLIQQAATWSVGALVLRIICMGLAYGLSLSSFRGGPTFPGMFIGAAAGVALSHLPGLPLIDGVGLGIGAMTVVMLGGLPLTAVLLTLVFLRSDAVDLISVVIVAVVVAWVASVRLSRWLPQPPPAPAQPPSRAEAKLTRDIVGTKEPARVKTYGTAGHAVLRALRAGASGIAA